MKLTEKHTFMFLGGAAIAYILACGHINKCGDNYVAYISFGDHAALVSPKGFFWEDSRLVAIGMALCDGFNGHAVTSTLPKSGFGESCTHSDSCAGTMVCGVDNYCNCGNGRSKTENCP